MVLPPHIGGEMGLSYPIFRLPNYPQRTGTRPGTRLGPHTATSRADGAASSGAPDRADRCPPRSSAGYRAPGRAAAASPGWGSRRYCRHAQLGMTALISSTGSSQVLIPEVSVTLL